MINYQAMNYELETTGRTSFVYHKGDSFEELSKWAAEVLKNGYGFDEVVHSDGSSTVFIRPETVTEKQLRAGEQWYHND